MKTTIEITFALMPMDVPSAFEMTHGEKSHTDKIKEIIKTAQDESAPACAPQFWSNPFPFTGNFDPSYVDALNKLTAALFPEISSLIEKKLNGLIPCPGTHLLDSAPMLFSRKRDKEQAKYQIRFATTSKCIPCGELCHKVDGLMYTSCPGNASFTPLEWKTHSNRKTVTYQIGVNCRFVLGSHS